MRDSGGNRRSCGDGAELFIGQLPRAGTGGRFDLPDALSAGDDRAHAGLGGEPVDGDLLQRAADLFGQIAEAGGSARSIQ